MIKIHNKITPALNEEQINAGYISTTEYTKEQIDEAYNYLINSSEGKTFIDSYKESMIAQPYFTSTSEQFNDSNYNSNSSIGLIDVSPEIIPAIRTGLTTVKATTDIVPSVFNGGKVVVNKLDDVYNEIGQKTSIYYNLTVKPSVESGIKFNVETGKAIIQKSGEVYDDVTLGVHKVVNEVSPTIGNKALDTKIVLPVIGTGEVINDIFNDSAPIPSTPIGAIGSAIKNINSETKESLEEKYDYLNKRYEEIKGSSENE